MQHHGGTFDLAILTLTFKILSGPFWKLLGFRKLANVGILNHGVTFNIGSVKVCYLQLYFN